MALWRRRIYAALTLTMLAAASSQLRAISQVQDAQAINHAHGTFEVRLQPISPAPAEGLTRMSIEKQVHGSIEGTTQGEMIVGGNPKTGTAGYVAMELFTGKVDGKVGSFALQHSATMDASGQKMQIIVVPGSGTGELKGITGIFTIKITSGQHFYDFDYALPSKD